MRARLFVQELILPLFTLLLLSNVNSKREGRYRVIEPTTIEVALELFFVDDETLQNVAALFGEEAVRVVEILEKVDEITDIQIADQTEIRLNTVRKTLYRLYDHSLVALRRSCD